jgi:hypothetical protein
VELAFAPRRDMAASRIGLDRLRFGIVSICGHLPWPASLPDRHEPQMTCQLPAVYPLSADLHRLRTVYPALLSPPVWRFAT